MTKTRLTALTAKLYQLLEHKKKVKAGIVLLQKPSSLSKRGERKSVGIFLTSMFIGIGILVGTNNAWADSEQNEDKTKDVANYLLSNDMFKSQGGETTKTQYDSALNIINRTIQNHLSSLKTQLGSFLSTYSCTMQDDGTIDEAKEDLQETKSDGFKLGDPLRFKAKVVSKISEIPLYPFSWIMKADAWASEKLADLVDKGSNALKSSISAGGAAVECLLNGESGQCIKNHYLQALLSNGFSWSNYIDNITNSCTANGKSEKEFYDAKTKIHDFATKLDQSAGSLVLMEKVAGKNVDVYQHCVKKTNKDGKTTVYCSFYALNTEEGTLTTLTGATQGCEPLPFKLHEARSCLFCPLYHVVFNAIQTASTTAYGKFGRSFSNLTAIGLAIWIAFMVLQNVSAMKEQKGLEFLTKLFQASFKVIIVIILLRNSGIIYNWILGPILKAGFDFGTAFLTYNDGIKSCSVHLKSITSNISGILPSYIYQNLMCFIEAVQTELASSQAIGSSLMCISRNSALTNLGPLARVIPDFTMMLHGAIIWIVSLIMSLAFGFYLIDATVQLGIFGMLLPFLLLCWPFKITNSYFKTGIGVFMNSWFIYVFMGVVVSINIQLIGQALTGGKGGFTAIETKINSNDVKGLQEILDIGFAGFLVLLACCIFSIKLLQKVEDLAGKFGGGGLGLGIGKNIGTTAVQAVKGAAQMVGNAGKSAGSNIYHAKVFQGADGAMKGLDDAVSSAGNKALKAVSFGLLGRR